MKKLPIGIQTFEKIRTENFLYVDKTEQIHRLITSGDYFFLSRPRRFGKSLTLSTIRAIYEGKRELFENLWIYDQWDWHQTRPVIHIQFNEIGYNTGGLENALHRMLDRLAEQHGIVFRETLYDQKFRELLEKLGAAKGKAVVLIDEYDKPLIDYLEKEELPVAFAHQKILKNFYSILKSADPYIELLLITGVSKFSKVSIFSDLNNLTDITLDPSVADLTGYTQAELEGTFADWIALCLQKKLAPDRESLLAKIKTWYNGYTWDSDIFVYNPFSILNFFRMSKFEDYWFKTGTPSFLIKKLEETGYFNLNELQASASLLESYSLDNLDVRALLFQTGYLTIRKYDPDRNFYTLGYPNREVEQALTNHLIGALLHHSPTVSVSPVLQLETAFTNNDMARVVAIINAMLKDVPSLLFDGGKEHFYHALVHLHFRYLGFFIQSEVHTSDGRMDAVVHTATHIYILEFKIDQSAEAALQQIRKKDYADRFGVDGKTVVGVGINFDTEKHRVSEWKEAVMSYEL
jgi:Predicted AAA-ATPase/PD-(D/E)XK nuclease superfamily